MEFTETSLSKPLLLAIEELGFKTLTPIQEKTIQFIFENNKDIIGLAETGTGKTAALICLCLIKSMRVKKCAGYYLIQLQLCIQITKDIENFSNTCRKFL